MIAQPTTDSKVSRLVSLDAFRGFTIAGMIVVNDPGSWGSVYEPLLHADWHGITPTDYIFPFFLFIVGVSVALAYTKRLQLGHNKSAMARKIVVRSAKIFLVGIFLALLPDFDFANVRIVGVLQRIAIVFLVCGLLFIGTSWRTQAMIAAVILLGYWATMALVPVPVDQVITHALETGTVLRSYGEITVSGLQQINPSFIAPNLEPGTNFAAWVDRAVTPGRLWEKAWDPEGTLSTIPSIATGISGMLAGALIVSKRTQESKTLWLFALSFLCIVAGAIWDWFFPINKNLWTSSFAVYTTGLALFTLAASLFFVDMLGYKKWTWPGIVFGANAITAYVLAGILSKIVTAAGLRAGFFNLLVDLGIDQKFSSFVYALLFTAVCYAPVYILYRKKIFIKL